MGREVFKLETENIERGPLRGKSTEGKSIIEGEQKAKYRRDYQKEKARWDAERHMKGNPYKDRRSRI